MQDDAVVAPQCLARVVRGRFLSLRTEEFVTAARLDGASGIQQRAIIAQNLADAMLRASRIVGWMEAAWDLIRAENQDSTTGGFMPRSLM